MIIEPVHICAMNTVIPVPYGLSVIEAWERLRLADQEGRPPWPTDTIIRNYVGIVSHPNGRILQVQILHG
jgi:hypothetical protein